MSLNNTSLRPLAGMNLTQLQQVTEGLGMPKFVATQLAQWIYGKRAKSFDQMLNISKANREKLSRTYCVGIEPAMQQATSEDGTIKYLFSTGDGQAVESVYIPEEDRATLCISSQKGCRMNCYFCMTGRQGYHGQLNANQIINQVLAIPQSEQLTNVVFMGMGEPTDNLEEVIKAIDILTAPWGLAWSPKRITVSSVGKKPELRALVERTSVNIAISVHNAVHEERLQMMPIEKLYPIKEVMQMLAQYDFAHQRRLSIEYIMWQWFNDDIAHAEALRDVVTDEHIHVNLIRYHKIPDLPKLRTSSDERMAQFRDYLNGHGIICTIRRSRGEDIQAACGMLAGKTKGRGTDKTATKTTTPAKQ